MKAKKRALLGFVNNLGLSHQALNKMLFSIDDESDWNDPQLLVERLHDLARGKNHAWTFEKVCRALEEAEVSMCTYKYHNIHVVGQWEENYPIGLRTCAFVPPIVFIQGDISILDHERYIALVGARKSCSWSYDIQKRLACIFVERGYGIVSGLAKGLDTASHLGCLQAKGKTIAVLAHGLGRSIYPKENQKLAQEIIAKEGCLISTYGWRVTPSRKRFLERNHIQVGLSTGVAFTAASMCGGTAYTIRIAEKEGLPVGYFFHEHRIWEPRALNDDYNSLQKGIKLNSQQGIDVFLDKISGGSMPL
ncbi:MAG: hypothetical protein CL916_09930 [Deltaproteobacteria bacterium]|nr:hypothetical protein [Deltaproteobacteria bacterium]